MNMSAIDLNTGALAPVVTEADLIDLRVAGEIPRGLNGVLVRNGPNPLRGRFEGNDVLSWWPEALVRPTVSITGPMRDAISGPNFPEERSSTEQQTVETVR
jgi:Retinal pigment epithelial membrane protein